MIRHILFIIAALLPFTLSADAPYRVTLEIKEHLFIPSIIKIPAGRKIKLTIYNRDATAEEFESYPLNREKLVKGGKKTTVWFGPLEPGEYPFFGEFNQETAQGKFIAVPARQFEREPD